MDKRKLIGRTSADLDEIFTWLPDASFCLDLAHARQVDPTMIETVMMLKKFGNRLKQIHLSDVNSRSLHEPLNLQALISYKLIAYLIDKNIPIILETPVTKGNIEIEIQLASLIFNEEKFANFFQSVGLYLNQSTGRVKAAF